MKFFDRFRKQEDEPTFILREQLALAIKAGRRCSHDLEHAVDFIGVSFNSEMYRKQYAERARMWLAIFYPADGIKDYRHRLHHDIMDLNREVERLRKLCEANKIDYRDPNGIPF